jgi:hypothetical protein
MAVSPEYRARAQKLAGEVEASSGRRKTWRKVTTLLDCFGVYRLTPAVRGRIAEALEDAGIEVEPAMDVVERYGTVRLSLRQSSNASEDSAQFSAPREAVTATLWRPGASPVPVSSANLPSDDDEGVLWLDVDVSEACEADAIYDTLTAFCRDGLTREMVVELLGADQAPKVKVLPGGVRNVTTFQVVADEGQGNESDPSASKTGTLSFQVVEFLQTERWLISCWHKRRPTPDGIHENPEQPPVGRTDAFERVEQWWRSVHRTTAGDLGLAVMAELAESYTHARRTLYAWHEAWELDFYRRRHNSETETLHDLRTLSARLREHLEALNRPGMSRNPDLIWFSHSTARSDAERVDDLIDRALANLRALSDILRSSTDVVATMSSSQQTRQAERFQELITLVAAVLLVPTLVAGIYGANTRLPGGNDWNGFALMIVTMVVSAALTYVSIQGWRRRGTADA